MYQTRTGVATGTGFVEANVPGSTNPKNLNINTAHLRDTLLVRLAISENIFSRNLAIGDYRGICGDVYKRKKVTIHERGIAFWMLWF
jgi:hypothetical protein